MTKTLDLAPGLSLPLEAATRRLAILAMSGAGKSNVAVVMAEQMFDAGIPWVAIDPKGDWWGVRSSKDGKGPGLPIPIFGGLHGDVPLEPSSGKLIGEMIVEQRLTCVLDISEFEDRQKQWGFLIDLGETLLRRNRQVLHLFLEEADEYLPQRTSEKGNLPKCLGVWQRVVKRGRFRGIGSTQITQRNASINKDTLYMAEAIIAMRVTGKADRAAVKGWVEYNNASEEIVASLPTLGDGEAWVSSPAWLKTTKRVQFNRRRTFDSGATPVMLKGGKTTPATLADIDLDSIRTQMAATIEKVKADDPDELRKQIAALKKERDVLARAAENVTSAPVLKEALDNERNRGYQDGYRTGTQHGAARVASAARAAAMNTLGDITAAINTAVEQANDGLADLPNVVRVVQRPSVIPQRPRPERPAINREAIGETSGMPAGEQRVLDALAELRELGIDPATRDQVGIFAGYNLSGGRPAGYAANVIKRGLVEIVGSGELTLSGSGSALARQPSRVPSLNDLHNRVLGRLDAGERRILEHLIAIYPAEASREDVGAAVGYNLAGGRPAGYVATLTTMGFAEIPAKGMLRAGKLLYPEGLS